MQEEENTSSKDFNFDLPEEENKQAVKVHKTPQVCTSCEG